MSKRVMNKLTFRVILPVAAMLMILCGISYFFLYRAAEEFANDQLRTHVNYHQNDIYNIISRAYGSLAPEDEADPAAVLVKKAEAIGNIDIYLNTNGMAGSVLQNDVSFYSFGEGGKQWRSSRRLAEIPAKFRSVVLFPQWQWKVVAVQDPTEFDIFTDRVRSAVFALLFSFVLMTAGVLLLLLLSVKKPIESIIREIKRNRPPDYHGVDEFEFLSKTIAEDMARREEYERLLVQSKDELEVLVEERTGQLRAEVEGHKLTAEQLFAEKERLAVTLHSISDGVITTDISGAVVLLNKVAEELTGWSMGEAVGQPVTKVFALFCGETGKPCDDKVQEVLATGDVVGVRGGAVLESRDGVLHSIADSCAPIRDRNNAMVGVVLAFRDISELKKLEEERFKRKNLESIGFLAGGIAHDFNNLLTVISGNIDLAALGVGADGKARALLGEAAKATDRAAGLTQQLLTFARGGAPVKETAHLEEIVRDSAGFVLRGSSVDYSFAADPDLWPVNADKGQISQVIQNLVLNASHAMPGGGTVDIVCRNQRHSGGTDLSLPPGNYVRIEVRDRGIGIPEEYVDRIFDPYFTTKAMGSEKGTGLGLSIVHSVVSKHGGAIQVQSQRGAGTLFTIHLPALITGAVEQGNDAEELVHGQGLILVMDDDEMVRTLAGQMLSHLGYGVVLTKDGAEVILRYQQLRERGRPVDAVIMDLTVPGGMGGTEAAAKLLEVDPQAKIIVASGYSNGPVVANFRQYGFVAAVEKPYTLARLSSIVKSVFP